MNVVDYLRSARALIAEPEHWTQHSYYRDANGNPVPPSKQPIFSYCAVGACDRVVSITAPISTYHDVTTALKLAAASSESLARFNDTHTHAEVLAVFDAAIEATK